MATSAENPNDKLKHRFAQLTRAAIPFNPLDALEFSGSNIDRLKEAMEKNKWKDLRFVTKEQAEKNGWVVAPRTRKTELPFRDGDKGTVSNRVFYNAETVKGIPTMEDMLNMSDAAIQQLSVGTLQNKRVKQAVPVAVPDSGLTQIRNEEEAITIAPAVQQEIGQDLAVARIAADVANRTTVAPEVPTQAVVPQLPARLQAGFMRLLRHGPAPYMMDDKNNANYYVELEDAQGEKSMVWGLDLPRSLEEAGAVIGDGITLNEVGAKNVTVQGRLEDGSIGPKPGRRIEWKTVVQPKVLEQDVAPSASDTKALASSADQAKTTAPGAKAEAAIADTRFAVMAPYWRDGLHNFAGLAMAEEINKAIKTEQLAGDKNAITRLLAAYPKARNFGIDVVGESQYLDDPWRKANPCEPKTLVQGQLVRDKEGAYRPKAGGMALLQDQGDALVLKSKGAEAYQGAMELALSKGWKAIELKGKPAMLADAWLEARMLGLDVVNYAPTDLDRAKYAERLAKESQRKAAEQSSELVEVRPAVSTQKPLAAVPNAAFAEPARQSLADVATVAAGPVVNEGCHYGRITVVDGNRIAQKVGREPDKIVWHSIANLKGQVPGVGDMAEIKYMQGKGMVIDKGLSQGKGVGR
ncbi:MAG: LPD7 domain-containing protein [Pseudomonadota bacterium]